MTVGILWNAGFPFMQTPVGSRQSEAGTPTGGKGSQAEIEDSSFLQQRHPRLCSVFHSSLCNPWPSRHDSLNGETVKPPQKAGFVSVLFFYGRALVILIN